MSDLLPNWTEIAQWGLEGVIAFGLIGLLATFLGGLLSGVPIVGPFVGHMVSFFGNRFASHLQKELTRMAQETVQEVEVQAAHDLKKLVTDKLPASVPPLLTSSDKRRAARQKLERKAEKLAAGEVRLQELEKLLESAHQRMRAKGKEIKAAQIIGAAKGLNT